MKRTELPFLRKKRGWKGRAYWYFERAGERTALPAPDDPGFLAAYDAARRGVRPVARIEVRDFRRLIADYRESARWARLAPRTKADYAKVLDWAAAVFGDLRPEAMERRHVLRAQAENRERLRFANYIVQVLSVLFEHATDLGWVKHNPAKGIRLLRGDGDGPHRPWTPEALEAYEAAAPGGSRARTVQELCIGTGQRIGDVLRMRWDQLRDGGIEVRQGKTGRRLWVPFTPRLKAYLAGLPRTALTVLADGAGRPLAYHAAAKEVMRARKEAGVEAFTIHGWRYTAAAELAAAGCSDDEIMAITGHRAHAMVRKYAGETRQHAQALAAQAKREAARPKAKPAKGESDA